MCSQDNHTNADCNWHTVLFLVAQFSQGQIVPPPKFQIFSHLGMKWEDNADNEQMFLKSNPRWPSHKWLKESPQLRNKNVRKVRAAALAILNLDPITLEEWAKFPQEQLHLTDNKLTKIIQRQPSIPGFPPESGVKPKLKHLKGRLGWDDLTLSEVIKSQPVTLALSIDHNIDQKLDHLQERSGWNDATSSKTAKCQPGMLHCGIEDNIDQTINCSQQRPHWDDATLSKVSKSQPSTLTNGIQGNINQKIDHLKERLAWEDATVTVSKVLKLKSQPSMLTLGIQDNQKLHFQMDILVDCKPAWGNCHAMCAL